MAEFPVVGNVFHPQNKQGTKYSPPSNNLKGMQTAGGNKFVMADTLGDQRILISNSNNKDTAVEIGFKGDGSITIKSNGPISLLAGGNITLDSKQDIILTAGNNVVVTAQKNMLLTTKDESLGLDVKQTLNLGAEDLAADFRNNLTIYASAQAKIRSQDTDII